MAHQQQHPQAGQTVTLRDDIQDRIAGADYVIEDWWDHLTGRSWMFSDGNPACLTYAIRSAVCGLPTDDEVLYGHTKDGLGHLVHVSEIFVAPQAGA